MSSAISSCNKGNSHNEKEDTVVLESTMKNVSYGSDTAQKLDYYLPANRDTANTKVLVFIHGGSWVGGDKNEFNEAIAVLRNRLTDYAFFNINYRLVNAINGLPKQIEDIESALEFIDGNAVRLGINPKKIVLIGASAGAHLALLHAYKNNREGNIKAVIDLFGPTDLVDMYNNHPVPQQVRYVLTNLIGSTPAKNGESYKNASPINFVNSHSVPTCIFHGSEDIVVPVAQSIALKERLLANNVKVEMTAYALEGHGWYGKNLLDTYNKTEKFIKENVR